MSEDNDMHDKIINPDADQDWQGSISVMLLQKYVAMIEVDYNTGISGWFTFGNGIVKKVHGRDYYDKTGLQVKFVHPGDSARVNDFHNPETVMRQYSKGIRQKEIEYRRITDGGGIIYVQADMYIYKDENGALKSQTYIEDVTESRKIKLAVKEAQREQHELELKIVSFVKDNYITIYEVIKNRDNLLQYELPKNGTLYAKELPGGWKNGVKLVIDRIAHPDDAEAYLSFFKADDMIEAIETRNEAPIYIYRRIDKNGGWRWCRTSVRGFRDQDGDFHLLICVQDIDREIRDSKKAEEEIKRAYSEAQRRAAELEGVGEMFSAIYRLNIQEDKLECIHISDEALVQNNNKIPHRLREISDNVYSEDSDTLGNFLSFNNISDIIKSDKKTVRELDYRLIHPAMGEYEWTRISLIFIPASEKHESDLFVTMQNIHEMKIKEVGLKFALEAALNSARQANAAKSNFLNNMSHDIRTPMNAIIGMINIAETHIGEPERVKDCLEKITVSASHLLGIINDVLDMSRIESGKMTIAEETVNLPEIMHRLITIIQPQIKSKDQRLIVDTSAIINETAVGDNTRLMQVFLNIMSNAVKFTPSGGTIEIRISQLPATKMGYGTYKFVFIDNGIGMSRDFLKKLFTPFERAQSDSIKVEGTGLGMTITKNIVDMMGGKIACQSEIGKGTTFIVTLELRLQEDGNQIPAPDELSGMPVLIVDDDGKTCENLSQLLEEAGMVCEWTLFGKEAVTRAEMMYRRGKPYKLYLIDWLMPDMSGIETTRLIRKCTDKDTPIFILTAYDWSDIETEAKEAGVTAFLSKPLFRSNLYQAMRQTTRDASKYKSIEKVPELNACCKHILIAEDNEINTEIVMELLNRTGAKVVCATDGNEAVRVFAGSGEGYFNLILMDIQMPSMNGYEATEAIRSMNRTDAQTVPIYAMTANVFAEDIKHEIEAKMNGHISKPISIKELYSVLKNTLA